MRAFFLVFILGFSLVNVAQINFDNELKLVSDSASERQVKQVVQGNDPSNGVPAENVQQQALIYSEVAGGNVISIFLSPAPTAYSDGLRVAFSLSSTNYAGVQIDVNSLGPISLFKNTSTPLDSAELEENTPYHAIYVNGEFRLLRSTSPSCPHGFEAVSRDYCIELVPDTARRWHKAVIACADKGARLCTMGEWMRACKKLNLAPSISAWEWVDAAGNFSSDAKVMGLDVTTASTPDCEYGRTYDPYWNAQFRCCYSR